MPETQPMPEMQPMPETQARTQTRPRYGDLAYVFWHRPAPGADPDRYEAGLARFHAALAAAPPTGFRTSWTLAVPPLPWLPGGGYEDWYVLADHTALGALTEAAVDPLRRPEHDPLAAAAVDGAGGLYRQLPGGPAASPAASPAPGPAAGPAAPPAAVAWTAKPPGTTYQQWHDRLAGRCRQLWQRQLVLGPAPEYRLDDPGDGDRLQVRPIVPPGPPATGAVGPAAP